MFKSKKKKEQLKEEELCEICHKNKALFVINDKNVCDNLDCHYKVLKI